jgi:hypothetical protein
VLAHRAHEDPTPRRRSVEVTQNRGGDRLQSGRGRRIRNAVCGSRGPRTVCLRGEAVPYEMGVQIASEKRRNPLTGKAVRSVRRQPFLALVS